MFFAGVVVTLLLFNQTSFAQTANGCIVGNQVYPTYLGIRKHYNGCSYRWGCDVYGGTPTTVDRTCDAVAYAWGYCYVSGRGEGTPGQVTKIQCPLDDYVWVLMFAMATTGVFFFRKHHIIKEAL